MFYAIGGHAVDLGAGLAGGLENLGEGVEERVVGVLLLVLLLLDDVALLLRVVDRGGHGRYVAGVVRLQHGCVGGWF